MTEIIPLSPLQRRILFVQKLYGRNVCVYNTPLILEIQPFDAEITQKTVNYLVARHEMLRSKIREHATNGAKQAIYSYQEIPIPIEYASDLQEYDQAVENEISKPFCLVSNFLFRCKMLVCNDDKTPRTTLVMTFHHIIIDGWSLRIIYEEFVHVYRAYLRKEGPTLAPIKFHYKDYVQQQVIKWQSDECEHLEQFWQQQFVGYNETNIFFDKPLPQLPDFSMQKEFLHLPTPIVELLQKVAKENATTLFTVLLGCFQLLIHRYSEQSDIVIGIPTHGRHQPQLKNCIGFFVNTLPIRTLFDNNIVLGRFIKNLHGKLSQIYRHQDLPFQQIIQQVNRERCHRYFPLVQIMFSFQQHSLPLYPDISIVNATKKVSSIPLALLLQKHNNGIRIQCQYHTAFFRTTTIKNMLQSYTQLLENAVKNTQVPISRVAILDDTRQKQMIQYGDNRRLHNNAQCVHKLFEQQVNKTPDAIAVVYQDMCYTYQQLNSRANVLAYFLKDRVKKQQRIAVLLDRSPEFIISILAILKLGCIYVPISTTDPYERIRDILQEIEPVIVLSKNLYSIPSFLQNVVYLDTIDWEETVNFSSLQIDNSLAAYIMFSSASTGKPKGIVISHKGISRLVQNPDYITIDHVNILQMAPLSFDASTFEIWISLLNGGKCVLFPQQYFDLKILEQCICKHQINVMWLTSSLFNIVIEENAQILRPLKTLIVGGEALSVSHIRKATKLLSETQIVNGYGPTESTVFTCCYKIPQDLEHDVKSIPIGKPVNNTQVYILDKNLQILPVGVVGELYISGEGLAMEYWRDAQLTSSKFIPHILDKGKRMYASGDLCRYLPCGNIDFIGRRDHQIKLRGFRIELREVEYHLQMISFVQKAFVKLIDGTLHAYIIIDNPTDNIAKKIRNELQQKIPNYMTPQTYTIIDVYPTTKNGKVDYDALPQPISQNTTGELPQGDLEMRIAAIWKLVISQKTILRSDHFFEIGGNSLKAIQVLPHIERLIAQRLEIECLFHYPVLEELCQFLQQKKQNNYKHIVSIQKRNSHHNLFCIHTAYGNIFHYYTLAKYLKVEYSIYGLAVGDYLYDSLESTAQEYIKEIQQIQPHGPYYIVGTCVGAVIAAQIAHFLVQKNEVVSTLILIDPSPTKTYSVSKKLWLLRWKKLWRLKFNPLRILKVMKRKINRQSVIKNNLYHQKQEKIRWHLIYLKRNLKSIKPARKTVFLYTKCNVSVKKSWQKVIPKLHIQIISGKHVDLFQEPSIEDLADKICYFLNKDGIN